MLGSWLPKCNNLYDVIYQAMVTKYLCDCWVFGDESGCGSVLAQQWTHIGLSLQSRYAHTCQIDVTLILHDTCWPHGIISSCSLHSITTFVSICIWCKICVPGFVTSGKRQSCFIQNCGFIVQNTKSPKVLKGQMELNTPLLCLIPLDSRVSHILVL